MVGRPERRIRDERLPAGEEARDRVDARDLERLGARERRKDAGKPSREHRLPGARGPHEQEVVRPGRRDLERPPGALLAAHVSEVGGAAPLLGGPAGARTSAPRSHPGSTRRPRRDAAPAPARCPRGRPPQPTRPRTRRAPALPAAPPRRPRARPRPGRIRPSSASSPTEACVASLSGGSCLVAPSTASEIGRSKPDPSLRSAAGARLTVIRRLRGHSSDAETTPLRTRCFASWHARSASPTIANPGTPGWRCASTSTRRGSSPTSAWVIARASTQRR